MSEEKIYQSPPSEPGDDFWLDQGQKLFSGSINSVREAAKALMTGLSLLQGIYLGILGFADFIPKEAALLTKVWFILPLLLWLISTYFCLAVLMTESRHLNLRSPDEIRSDINEFLVSKQKTLMLSFWSMAAGLLFVLFLFLVKIL